MVRNDDAGGPFSSLTVETVDLYLMHSTVRLLPYTTTANAQFQPLLHTIELEKAMMSG